MVILLLEGDEFNAERHVDWRIESDSLMLLIFSVLL